MTDPSELGRGGSAERQACIPPPLRDLHRAILRQFLQTGMPPTAAGITDSAADLGLAATAVADLEAADLVYTADGIVIVAYPFSGTPTRQQVELDGFPAVYAMCAIDALGIPAMTGRDGRITATDPHDDGPVQVSVRGRTWTWTPAGAVVVYGRTTGCGTDRESWKMMCPHTTFHASRESARAYLAARPDIDGKILGQQAAIDLGRHIFGPLLGHAAGSLQRSSRRSAAWRWCHR
jgi:hypothetical protein